MKKKSETIVFFGSGPVAAKSLAYLAEHFSIEAVVTKPRAAHHKGDVPVLGVAERLGLPIRAVTDRKSLDALFDTRPFASPLGIIVDFGIIVSQKVIDYFPKSIINSHFSLLPEWRGADPITFAVLSGQKRTGVSIMLLVAALDEGPILAQAPYDLLPETTTPRLTDDLVELSNETLRAIIPLWLDGQIAAAPQESVTIAASTEPTYSRRLMKDDGILDWQKSADVLEREVRAFAGWPQSRTQLAGKDVIITKAHVNTSQPVDIKPGGIKIVQQTGNIMIATTRGWFCVDRLKPSGKSEMESKAFLAGYGRKLT